MEYDCRKRIYFNYFLAFITATSLSPEDLRPSRLERYACSKESTSASDRYVGNAMVGRGALWGRQCGFLGAYGTLQA